MKEIPMILFFLLLSSFKPMTGNAVGDIRLLASLQKECARLNQHTLPEGQISPFSPSNLTVFLSAELYLEQTSPPPHTRGGGGIGVCNLIFLI